jgi:hypothetical protein
MAASPIPHPPYPPCALGKIKLLTKFQLFEHHDGEPADGRELTIVAEKILERHPGDRGISQLPLSAYWLTRCHNANFHDRSRRVTYGEVSGNPSIADFYGKQKNRS